MKKQAVTIGTISKRKATNAGKQALYTAMWREEPPKKYRKCGSRSMLTWTSVK